MNSDNAGTVCVGAPCTDRDHDNTRNEVDAEIDRLQYLRYILAECASAVGLDFDAVQPQDILARVKQLVVARDSAASQATGFLARALRAERKVEELRSAE